MPLNAIGATNQGMAEFLPTKQAFRRIAKSISLEPTDKAVEQVFDALVLRRNLKPFLPRWWELCRLNNRVVLRTAVRCGALPK